MKVTVTKYLNVRVGKPSVNAPCYQYLAPGSEIETDGQIYKGDLYKDIDTWVKDEVGNYYWTGGIQKSLESSLKSAPGFESLVNYHKLIITGAPIPPNMGAGINVALLDSGIDISHPDLAGAVVYSKNFIDGSGSIHDVWGHGTLMAGFIGGRSVQSNGIIGVAPQCNLCNYKVSNDQGVVKVVAVKQCLNFILNDPNAPTIHVINMSISVSDLDMVADEITKLRAKGVKIVVAAGNESLLKQNYTRLLAQHPGTIGVATLQDPNYFSHGGNIPAGVDCFYSNNKLFSTRTGGFGYDAVSGDSVYTALTTGLVAVIGATPLSTYCHPRQSFNIHGIKIFN